jgi:ABC-2 type transport system ATP-binding protein
MMRELRSVGGTGARSDAVTTDGLTKRYGSVLALQDCSLFIPKGSVTALIGSNGAGKTTLLQLLACLSRPTSGEVTVFGKRPAQTADFLADVGFLAQEAPLYRRLDAEDHLGIGAHLNPRWDTALARDRLARLRVPMDRAVGTLSGGQRAQVALTIALAKRPRLLLLDEPVAALDPLARREFLAGLSEAVADGELTVVISSHLLLDLERICDHLVLLNASRTQLCEPIETLLAEHKVLTGRRQPISSLEHVHQVVSVDTTPVQTTAVVRLSGPVLDPAWEVSDVSLEELVLVYMSRDSSEPTGTLSIAAETR